MNLAERIQNLRKTKGISQETGAVAAGFVFIILGLMLHAMGTRQSPESRQAQEKFRFWKANIWTVSFLPLSLF